ncbi:hypothetical protein SO802_010653 [Lithocarpus litseifolius]|uniref:Transmembrane protein n=1 Tax=Lithocarpus litseifolius TaxID=425828 RepID=A0AAW2DJB4_9ROSI
MKRKMKRKMKNDINVKSSGEMKSGSGLYGGGLVWCGGGGGGSVASIEGCDFRYGYGYVIFWFLVAVDGCGGGGGAKYLVMVAGWCLWCSLDLDLVVVLDLMGFGGWHGGGNCGCRG